MLLQRTQRAAFSSRQRADRGLSSNPRLLAPVRRQCITLAGNNGTSSTQTKTEEELDDCADNVAGEYCTIDERGRRVIKRSLGEMEQDFLGALGSWYYDGKPSMSDEDFTLLKEELIWAGSKVAILDSNEQRFLEASMAYAKGKPIMSDEDYDKLKSELKIKSSVVSAEGPRCSLRSKKMYADVAPDYLKMTLLNLPAVLLVLGFIFAIDDITGFEITEAIELPPPWGTILLWGVLLPTLFIVSNTITNLAFKDYVILSGPCPNCGTVNFSYFGSILSVPGNRGRNVVECGNCKSNLTYDENKRIVIVDETPEQRQEKAAAAAAAKKKAAAAAAAKKAAPAAAKSN